MKKIFTLEYWIDDGWYVGRLKEVPGVFSQAKTLKELKNNIRDAYQMMLKEQRSFYPDKLTKTKINKTAVVL